MSKAKKRRFNKFLGGWEYYLKSHTGLVSGLWVPQDIPPNWGVQVVATLLTTPVTLWLGMWLGAQAAQWVVIGIIASHVVYSLLAGLEIGAQTDFQATATDIIGRFLWQVATTTVVVGMWRLITLLLF